MNDKQKAFDSSHNVDAAGESGGSLLGHLWASVAATVLLTIICCGVYPLVVWGLAQAIFPNQANGSLVKKDGTYTTKDAEAVGSSLLGQNFSAPEYFHPRPSAAGAGYDATNSSGSNLGPLSDKLINGATTPATTQPTTQPETLAFDGIRLRTLHYAIENGITFETNVPLDPFKDKDGNPDDVKLVDAFHDSNTPLVLSNFSKLIPGDAVTASGSGLDPHISPVNAAIQKARVAKTRGISEDEVQKLIDQNTDQPNLGVLGDPGVNVLMLNLALDAKHAMPAPTTQPASK